MNNAAAFCMRLLRFVQAFSFHKGFEQAFFAFCFLPVCGNVDERHFRHRRMREIALFLVQNNIDTLSRVNGKRSVARHIGNDVGVSARRVYDKSRINRAAVGLDAFDFAVFDLHSEHRGIQTNVHAVFRRVFRKCDRKLIRRNHTARWHIVRAARPFDRFGFDFQQFFSVDISHSFDFKDF